MAWVGRGEKTGSHLLTWGPGARLLVVSGAGLLLACGSQEEALPPLEVGVVVPFAGTGLMAEAEQAWQIVVDEVNANGGANGKTLRVHQRDTPLSDAADLAPVAQGFVRLTEEGYKYIISLVSGTAMGPIVDVAVPHGVLAMSITSEEPAEELPARDGMLLRGILSTDRLIQIQASALQASGLTSMVIVGETRRDLPDSRQSAMIRAFASCVECSVATVSFPLEADLYRYDWAGVGAEVNGAEPDVVFLASANASALLDAVHAIDRGGYQGLYYFAYAASMRTVADALGNVDVARRFRAHDLALPPSDHLARFMSLYEERYADEFVPEPRLIAFADYLSLLSLAVSEVGDADPHRVAMVMKQIAGPPGDPFTPLDYPEAVRALREGRDIDFVGFSGPMDFDEWGEVSDGFVEEYAVTGDGEIAPLP